MVECVEVAEDREEEAAPEPGVAFMQLGPGMCRFPLGGLYDPPLRFCGEPAPVGSPYCQKCRAIAYVPSRRA
jgi:GcrA cell cycle regulator